MITMASGDPQNRQNLACARGSVIPHHGQARSAACLISVRDAESRTFAAPGSAAPQWRQNRFASSDAWPQEGQVFMGAASKFEGNGIYSKGTGGQALREFGPRLGRSTSHSDR